MGDTAGDLTQIAGTHAQLLSIECHIAVSLVKAVDGCQKEVVEFATAAVVVGKAFGLHTDVTAGVEHGLVDALSTTEVIGESSAELVGMTVLAGARRQVGGLEHDSAEGKELLADGLIDLRLYEQVAAYGVEHRGIDDITGAVLAHELCHDADHIGAAQ